MNTIALSRRSAVAIAVVGIFSAWSPLSAQESVATGLSESTTTAAKTAASELLSRLVTMTVTKTSIAHAIDVAAASAKVALQYDTHVVDAFRYPVSVHVTKVPLRVVLDRILSGTTLTVVPDGTTRLAIVDARAGEAADDSTGMVMGTVMDPGSSKPVADATITIQGTKFATRSLTNGRFAIAGIPTGTYVIIARRLGHLSQERRLAIKAGDTTHINLQLTAVPAVLQGVVTTGAGDRTKLEVGNAISTINADSVVRTTPIRNMADLLNGRVAGLDVTRSTGTVGSGSKIRIRGESSLMAMEDPVVIVDGVRFDDAYSRARTSGYLTPALNNTNPYAPASSRLDDIDPESIESIDVLKGPAASALYGSDAANGVIVVKTKHGRAGPTRWSMSGQTSRSTQKATYPDSYFGWGKIYGTVPSPTTCTLANVAADACSQDSVSHFNPLNHSGTSPFTPGDASQFNGQVSGGTDRQQYFVSASYENERGVLGFPSDLVATTVKQLNGLALPSWAKQPNLLNAVAISTTLTNEFGNADLSLSGNGRRQYHRDVAEGPTGFIYLAGGAPGYEDTLNFGWGTTSPASGLLTRIDEQLSRGWGALTGNWRPLSLLTIHGTGGIDYSSNDQQRLLPQNYVLSGASSGRGRVIMSNYLKTGDGNATFDLPVSSALSLRTTGGMQYTSSSVDYLSGAAYNLSAGSVSLAGGTTSASEYSALQETLGWYLQETASLNQRLFATVAIRNDASSAFGGATKSVNYPKWNASWLVSEEPFFPRIPALNSLRLRIGYGHAGANPPYDGQYRTYRLITGFSNGTTGSFIDLNSVGNSDILPERSVETEGGFDLGLFDDRATIGFTIADKKTRNALVTRTLPPSFGPNATQVQNLGGISNKNYELEATFRPLVSRALSWTATLVTSQTHNELTSLGTAQPTPAYGPNTLGAQNRFVPGYPVDGVWTRAVLAYTDANHNGIIEANEIRYADSSTYAGEYAPSHTLGWQNNVSILSGIISVGANFTYEGNALQYNSLLATMCQQYHTCRGAVDPTAPLSMQAAAVSSGSTTWAYLEHVRTFRFDELSLTWNAPSSIARQLRSQRVAVSLMGRNLKFWTRYHGADPDVNTSNQGGDIVADQGAVPQPRTWALRVNIGY